VEAAYLQISNGKVVNPARQLKRDWPGIASQDQPNTRAAKATPGDQGGCDGRSLHREGS
jgi:hypothetical protein